MRILLTLFVFLMPLPALAQGVATLVADQVTVEDNRNRLVATGNIEVFYEDTRLSARRITFDRALDQLFIEGPIYIQTADGEIITAERGTLDPQLENGILRGARLVLNQQLQLASNQIDRVDGNFSQLTRVVASSCTVCDGREALWDIRADRVVHDQDAQQLYFEHATFHVRGVPVFYLPYARLPDPTLDRSTGFLFPRFRTSGLLGTGAQVPYFITLGDSRDLTLIPFLTTKTRTIEAIYRQAFLNGDLEIRGAFSDDDLRDDNRAFLFVDGQFELPSGTDLSFDIQTVTDRAFLEVYDFSSLDQLDRLESNITLQNITDDRLFSSRLSVFQSLRDDEENATLPPVVGDVRYERRQDFWNGVFSYGVSADGVIRTSAPNGEDARDTGRLGGFGLWSRTTDFSNGIRSEITAGGRADYYLVLQDDDFDESSLRAVPTVGATLSLPLISAGTNGTTHLFTPIVSLAWSDVIGDDPPNEDSTRTEFDQANLFDLSRFAGDDRVETGFRAAAGAVYARQGRAGSFSTLTFGRVVREDALSDFTSSSGLSGETSEWLVAGQVTTPQGIHFDGRILFDDDLNTTLGVGRVEWETATIALNAAYIWQDADDLEDRPTPVNEFNIDTAVRLNEAFLVRADARYDLEEDAPSRAGLGVEWRNECVTVDLSASRRFTTSDTVDPSTDYSLSVSLNGFSSSRTEIGPSAGCDHQ